MSRSKHKQQPLQPNQPQPITHHATANTLLVTKKQKRRHNTLKERIKRRMAGEASTRHRELVLEAASALAGLKGGGDRTSLEAHTHNKANTQMVDAVKITDTAEQCSSVANNDLHGDKERWTAAPAAAVSKASSIFPQTLMSVLSNDQVSDIITWLPHGKGFIILQTKKFVSDVLPQYFKHAKFSSFTRKLHRWGFTRVARGPESGTYYHEVSI